VLYFVEICGIEMCELIIRISDLRGTIKKFVDLRQQEQTHRFADLRSADLKKKLACPLLVAREKRENSTGSYLCPLWLRGDGVSFVSRVAACGKFKVR
jgi:hypothetical protein